MSANHIQISGESKALRPPDNAVFENMIKGANCNCPMDCQDTVYTQEISQANMRPNSNIFNRLRVKPNYLWHLQDLMEKNSNNTKKVRKYNQTIQDIIENSSVVHFYFKETGVVLFTRDELYGIMDLVGMIFYLEQFNKNFYLILILLM